jgi:iron complex outermembrane recepter protein
MILIRNRVCKALLPGVSYLALMAAPAFAEEQKAQEQAAGSSTEPSIATASAAIQGNSGNGIQEIVVTAQKRAQGVNSVGMSITAATGDQLTRAGITTPADLVKIVPGFNFTQTAYATPVYTIRGVGFQESTLASSPAVSVYVDEVPLPFPIETSAAGLDVERVEVLKGPQGTLYGENSTGGAVNYIAAKPTSTPTAGLDLSYGRFNTADWQGYVSGPIGNTLKARLSLRAVEGGDYQKSYTTSATLGQQFLLQGRLLLDWQVADRLKISVNVNGWRDRSDTPASQMISITASRSDRVVDPIITNYPISPENDRAAGWNFNENFERDNSFYQGSLRADYDLGGDVELTSISSYQHFHRDQPQDQDGTPATNLGLLNLGRITTFFQELRLSGKFPGERGSWILGGNYERSNVNDTNYFLYSQSTNNELFGISTSGAVNFSVQRMRNYAAYGNVEYPILDTLSLLGAVRYTQANRSFQGCTQDNGDGSIAAIFNVLQGALKGPGNVIPIQPGGCVTLNAATLNPGLQTNKLNQHNVSWRGGVNWKPSSMALIYANISKGYKAGSFPTLPTSTSTQIGSVTQEALLAYEAGFKIGLLDRTLELRGAGFYYDYKNKQIRGRYLDPIFGALEALVNIPKSRVVGFELSADWRPVRGLTLSPAVTMVDSKIQGDFSNYTIQATTGRFSGEPFPYTPKWQAQFNAQYRRDLSENYVGFVGTNVNHQSATNGGFGQISLYRVKPYTLVDLQAGIETVSGNYRLTVWGRNITNEYYWTYAGRGSDTNIRYAGMPVTYGATFSARFK